MPESVGMSATTCPDDIPDDIRHLKNFPHYDNSLHDTPRFRQQLSAWANKTEKLSNVLDTLATGFSDFYSTGLQQYKAASTIVGSLQKMSQLLENSSPTITEPINNFVESMNNMWYYYETFLEQTQTLTVDPIRKMAKQFSTLKGIYEELQRYRKEFIMAADQMCASRHVSKLNDSQQFNQLAESCYNAQRTYQLVLARYITLLREVHTIDMMDLLRRLMEHFLSIYSYHNYCSEQMKHMEVYLSNLFLQTKNWKTFYHGEMEVWKELQRHIERSVKIEHQNHVDSLPTDSTSTSRLGVLKPMKKKAYPHSNAQCGSPSTFPPPSLPFLHQSNLIEQGGDRRHSPVQPRKTPLDSPVGPPIRTFSIPVFPESSAGIGAILSKKDGFSNRLKLRSSSDADILVPTLPEENTCKDEESTFDDTLSGSLRRRSQSIDDLNLSGDDKEASLETASQKIEEALGERKQTNHKHFLSLLANKKKEIKEKKKLRHRTPSLNEEGDRRSRSGSTTPVDAQSADNSPFVVRKNKRSLHKQLKKARNSLHLFRKEKSEEEDLEGCGPINGRGHVEGCGPNEGRVSAEGSSISSGENPLEATLTNNSTVCSSPSPAAHTPTHIPISPPHLKETADVKCLITSVPSSWNRAGYLMLRMKLPNNTYAWTYIYCVVNKDCGQLMVQEQSLPDPRPLEDLMLCTCKAGTPEFIDRNFCFRVISPSTEHLFQALGEEDMKLWMSAIQEGIEEVIKHGDTGTRPKHSKREDEGEIVPNAMKLILKVPGNKQCADCSSTDVQWASINLGIVLCIECSGVHRGLGVHVSKVRSLTLDKWNKTTVEFMQSQGNTKSNTYYEARLGKGTHSDIHKPSANAGKAERMQFVQLKYVTLAFTPELAAAQ